MKGAGALFFTMATQKRSLHTLSSFFNNHLVGGREGNATGQDYCHRAGQRPVFKKQVHI